MPSTTELDVFRNTPGIDPTLHVWGWEIPVYLFLGGLAAGLLIVSSGLALRRRDAERSVWIRRAPMIAVVVITAGMLALWLDLAHRWHAARFYLTMRPTSPMSWGAWILAGLYPAAILFNIAAMSDSDVGAVGRLLRAETLLRRVRDWGAAHLRAIAWINLALGLALGAYTGILLGTLAARPLWSSVLLGPLFLVSGISAGAALMLLFPLDKLEHSIVTRWDLWAIGTEVLLLAMFFLDLYTGGGAAGKAATGLFWGGRFTAVFWTLVVAVGLVVPWLIESEGHRRRLAATVAAPVLVLVGGLALRWIFVAAGQV